MSETMEISQETLQTIGWSTSRTSTNRSTDRRRLSGRCLRPCPSSRPTVGSFRKDSVQGEDPNKDETKHELLQRISVDPNICFGKPCVRGHRIWVSLVLDMLSSGMSHEEILQNYPGLEESDLRACIAYGAEMS